MNNTTAIKSLMNEIAAGNENAREELVQLLHEIENGSIKETTVEQDRYNITEAWFDAGRLDENELEGKDSLHEQALGDIAQLAKEQYHNNVDKSPNARKGSSRDKDGTIINSHYVDGLVEGEELVDLFEQGIKTDADLAIACAKESTIKASWFIKDRKASVKLSVYAKRQISRIEAQLEASDDEALKGKLAAWKLLKDAPGRLRGMTGVASVHVLREAGQNRIVEEVQLATCHLYNRWAVDGVSVEIPQDSPLNGKFWYANAVMAAVDQESIELECSVNDEGFNQYQVAINPTSRMLSLPVVDTSKPWETKTVKVEGVRLVNYGGNKYLRYSVIGEGALNGVMADELYFDVWVARESNTGFYAIKNRLEDLGEYILCEEYTAMADAIIEGEGIGVLDATIKLHPSGPVVKKATSQYNYKEGDEDSVQYYIGSIDVVNEEHESMSVEERLEVAKDIAKKAIVARQPREKVERIVTMNLA